MSVTDVLLQLRNISSIVDNTDNIWNEISAEDRSKLNNNIDKYDQLVRKIAQYIYAVHPNNKQEVIESLYPQQANQLMKLFNDPIELLRLDLRKDYLYQHYQILNNLFNTYSFELVLTAVKLWESNYNAILNRIYSDYVLNNDNIDTGSDDTTHDFTKSIAFNNAEVTQFLILTKPELINNPNSLIKINELITKHICEDYYYIDNIYLNDIRLIE